MRWDKGWKPQWRENHGKIKRQGDTSCSDTQSNSTSGHPASGSVWAFCLLKWRFSSPLLLTCECWVSHIPTLYVTGREPASDGSHTPALTQTALTGLSAAYTLYSCLTVLLSAAAVLRCTPLVIHSNSTSCQIPGFPHIALCCSQQLYSTNLWKFACYVTFPFIVESSFLFSLQLFAQQLVS